jgi:predicted amidohydrolase YtcJ
MNVAKIVIALSLLATGVLSHAAQTTADLVLTNGRVYTLSWPDPDPEGRPAAGAPHDANGWRPDADTVALSGTRIVFVGRQADAPGLAGQDARSISRVRR